LDGGDVVIHPTAPLVEPAKDRDASHLLPPFRVVLAFLLANLQRDGQPFKMDEGKRSVDRQAWLFASGRTRDGAVVTQKDGGDGVYPNDYEYAPERGASRASRHQRGDAADLYPSNPFGMITIPPASDPVWTLLEAHARRLGLRCGRAWGDSPHVEGRA
jgi:hypothetical protein